MKTWWRAVRPRVVAWPIWALASLICRSLRLQIEGLDRYQSLSNGIMVTWHGRSLIGAFVTRNRGYWALISLSNDGNIQHRIFRLFGFRTIRGSTGRGGVKALSECIRALRDGGVLVFTPDGPRGPSHEVQMGCLVMAQKSGAALVPVGASAKRRWLANSWDRYMIPKPFSPAIVLFGEPITVPAAATPEEMEAIRLRVQEAMIAIENEAEARMGHPPAWPPPGAS